MSVKLTAVFAAFIMLFVNMFSENVALPESRDVLKERTPAESETRTYDRINGVGGSVFYIERPSDRLQVVYASDFGMSADSEDNFDAFTVALEYCRTHSGVCLKLDNGVYRIKNKQIISLAGFKDVMIDGDGATLVFSEVVTGFHVYRSDCVEFRNLKIDWDWESKPLSDIAVVANVNTKKNELDFVFPELENADENMIFAAISQCEPGSYTYGTKESAKEHYVYQNPSCIKSVTKTDKNVLHIEHNGAFKGYKNGETYIVRHYVYDTSFMVLAASKNITVDNVCLYGYPGSGYVVSEKTSHFQIINSRIGADTINYPTRHTSLGSDAIHIVNTNGCFNISNCDISGQGDDALNVHDGLGCVDEVNGNVLTVTANAMYINDGDSLSFRDDKFNATEITATVTKVEKPAYDLYRLTFDRDLSSEVGKDYIIYSNEYNSGNYVIRNNYFHENRARALLLQSPYGLCENNRFYKTEMQAIKIVMDISRGLWYEGTGVDRLVVRNNSFEMCDYICTGEVITVGTNLNGKVAVSQPFTNIEITDNSFVGFPKYVINANNVNGLVFAGNTVSSGKTFPNKKGRGKSYFGKYCSNVIYENNRFDPGRKQTAECENIETWARINSQLF